jgi:8-oxo-dGTP diphosphatase
MPHTYEYPRPALTVDAVVFAFPDNIPSVLLIQRDKPPFEGCWALPGGFVEMNETLEEAIARELEEETGLKNIRLEQLHAFSAIDRDPRGRTVTVAFYGMAGEGNTSLQAGDDARTATWFPLENIPPLAFDHQQMLNMGSEMLKMKKQ